MADIPAPVPTYDDVQAAAERLDGLAVRTPLLESDLLNRETGRRILLKAEVLQRTGSFKFRGAYNAISRLSGAQKYAGIVTYSSGNHAQGVALAARLCGLEATIIMPRDTPEQKIANTRALGADIVPYDRFGEDRDAIGRKFVEDTGAVLVKPYDDFHVIAGQGTCGLEIAAQCAAGEIAPDALVIPCGGGGLAAGVSLAMEKQCPGARLYTAEPAEFDDWRRSLEAGGIRANKPGATSICDAILTPEPGEMTFAIAAPRLAGGLTVTDDEVRHAMRVAFARFKLIVEPGGAVALAAALAGKIPGNPRTVVIIATGGNVDPALFAGVLSPADA